MANAKKKVPLLSKWLKLSILVLLVPILVSSFLYSVLILFLNKSINDANETAFFNATGYIDEKLEGLTLDLSYLATTEQYRKAVTTKQSDSDQITNSDKILFQRELKRIKRQYNFVERINVYFNDSLIICDNFLMDIERLKDEDLFTYRFGSGLENQIRDVNTRNMIFYQQKESMYSFLFHTIFLGASSDYKATVMVTFDNYKFQSFIKESLWTDEQHIILEDGYGGLFFAQSDSYTESPNQHTSRLSRESNYFDIVYKLSAKSSTYSTLYIVILSVVIGAGVLSAVIGLMLTISNTKTHFKPLKDMIGLLDADPEDIDKLTRLVKKLVDENRFMHTSLVQNKDVLTTEFIFRLLKNQPVPMPRKELCQKYGLPFENAQFILIMITSRDIMNIIKNLDYNSFNSVQNIISSKSKELINKVFANYKNIYFLEAENAYYVLIATAQNADAIDINAIKNACTRYRNAVNREVSFQTSLAISTVVQNMDGLNTAYNQVREAMQFIGLLGSDNEIVYYPSISGEDENVKLYKSSEREKELAFCIRNRNFATAKQIMNDIMQEEFNISHMNQMLKFKVFSLINTVVTSMQEVENSLGDAFVEALNPVARLQSVDSAQELSKAADVIFDECVNFINSNYGESTAWVQDIKNYIEKHFSDPNLNVGMIAERFNFSLSYLSRAFKKNTGQGIFDYIQTVRIDNAKRRIKSNEKIVDIATEIGYLDSRTFIRAFKKYEGVTPGKYR